MCLYDLEEVNYLNFIKIFQKAIEIFCYVFHKLKKLFMVLVGVMKSNIIILYYLRRTIKQQFIRYLKADGGKIEFKWILVEFQKISDDS